MPKDLEDLKRDLELLEDSFDYSGEGVIKIEDTNGDTLEFYSTYEFLGYLSEKYKSLYKELDYVVDDVHESRSLVCVFWTDLEGRLDSFSCRVERC